MTIGGFTESAWGLFNITAPMVFDTTENADIVTGSELKDYIYGKGGNDSIAGASGDDLCYGEFGSDLIYGGDGNDIIDGGRDTAPDDLYGDNGADELIGYRGADLLNGGSGNDILRAGNGRDIIDGGDGADLMYGGFGLNTFKDERDGSVDNLYIRSDQWEEKWIYGKAGNSANGEKADKIEALDEFDKIYFEGISDSQLSYGSVNHVSQLGETLSGLGIYASGVLEAVYVGGNLNLNQLNSMTQGIL
jgi:Ca2+-binding RTX toxin-like protein